MLTSPKFWMLVFVAAATAAAVTLGDAQAATYNFYFNGTEQGDHGVSTPTVIVRDKDGAAVPEGAAKATPGAAPAVTPLPAEVPAAVPTAVPAPAPSPAEVRAAAPDPGDRAEHRYRPFRLVGAFGGHVRSGSAFGFGSGGGYGAAANAPLGPFFSGVEVFDGYHSGSRGWDSSDSTVPYTLSATWFPASHFGIGVLIGNLVGAELEWVLNPEAPVAISLVGSAVSATHGFLDDLFRGQDTYYCGGLRALVALSDAVGLTGALRIGGGQRDMLVQVEAGLSLRL